MVSELLLVCGLSHESYSCKVHVLQVQYIFNGVHVTKGTERIIIYQHKSIDYCSAQHINRVCIFNCYKYVHGWHRWIWKQFRFKNTFRKPWCIPEADIYMEIERLPSTVIYGSMGRRTKAWRIACHTKFLAEKSYLGNPDLIPRMQSDSWYTALEILLALFQIHWIAVLAIYTIL